MAQQATELILGCDSNGTAAQSFKLSACSLVDSGTYTIAASSNRSKVLDVASGSRSNGANVQLWSSNGSGAQKWNVSVNSDGTVSIQNCRSKKNLDVLNAQGASGANVQQWQGNGSACSALAC
ncbi:MAG: RICIN domain-containing protein [Collinsella sp.]